MSIYTLWVKQLINLLLTMSPGLLLKPWFYGIYNKQRHTFYRSYKPFS